MVADLLVISIGAILINNFVLVQFLGICPFLGAVSYTHLRAHETGRNLVCRLLLEKKKKKTIKEKKK